MVMGDLSVVVIQAKIAASDCVFDTSPEGLRQLKAARVPDEIVLEMIKRTTRCPPDLPVSPAIGGPCRLPDRPSLRAFLHFWRQKSS